MTRILFTTLALCTLIGCGDVGNTPELTLSLDTAGLEQDERTDDADTVYSLLNGNFDSLDQASADRAFFPVSLRSCEAIVEGLGDRVLYVEQAMMDALDRPYRQRIYSVEEVEGRVVSRVYAMDDSLNRALTGACENDTAPVIQLKDIEERRGCEVWLSPDQDGVYRGGTEGQDCQSTLSGARYATSKVLLYEGAIESWDRGWASADEQVWGAVSGPYVFKRTK